MSLLEKDIAAQKAEQGMLSHSANPSRPRPSRPMGGMFSPLAQYPGAGYEEVFSTGRKHDTLPVLPQKTAKKATKEIVRTKVSMAHTKQHSFRSALLLVEMEGNARMDRAALRDAGVNRVQVLTSGLLASRFLSLKTQQGESTQDHNPVKGVDLVVCHPRLEDMSSLQWIELIRLNPALRHLPVITIAGSVEEGALFQALNCNFTSILTRPYSQDDMRLTLAKVQEKTEKALEANSITQGAESTEEFESTIKRLEGYQHQSGKGEQYFHEGLKFLKEKAWDKAIVALNKALYNKEMKGEAEYGLAAAWQGKKNIEKQSYYLNEACLTLVRSQKWARARLAYTQLLKVMPNALNPFVRTAESLVRAQKFRDAGATLVLGLGLGNTEDVVERMARACFYTENPPFTLSQIQKAFTAQDLQSIVQALPQALQAFSEKHEKSLQKRRDEQALLRQKAREMKPASYAPRAFGGSVQNHEGQKQSVLGADFLDLAPLGGGNTSFGEAHDEEFTFIHDPKLAKKQKAARNKSSESFFSRKNKKDADATKNPQNTVLTPLQEDDLAVQMFSPGLNELATVIKTTWKLMNQK